MSIALYRIDDRLIHGQVVVGWGKPLNVGFIVLVDDAVRASAWEQELYRMGVPADIEVVFASTEEALERLPEWERDPRVGILVAGDIGTLAALTANRHRVSHVNVGGLHHRPGRSERLRYVYLSDAEAAQLKTLAARGVEVTAQDVPTAAPVPLEAGDPRVLERVHAAGILRDAVRAAVVTALGLVLAQVARAYLAGALPPHGVALLNVAAVGAALAAGTAGTLRLVGRGPGLRWFAAGVVGGTVVAWLR